MQSVKSRRFPRLALLGVVAAAVALGGCASKVTRTVDVNKGDYYTPEEVKNLSKDQYASYCASLDAELSSLQKSATDTKSQADQSKTQLASVQSQVKDLEAQNASAQADLKQVQDQVAYFEGLPKTWTVQKGEFLHKISGYEQIYSDPLKWPRIYRANKDKIQDPNLIEPGWVLAIPRDWPKSWTVVPDEYLSKIAGYWEVYNQPSSWPRLYEANKDRIKDPDLIQPGWVLTIPREEGGSSTATTMQGK